MPDQTDLHTLAARAYVKAGKTDEAMAELKEATAHDPDGIETRMLVGELNLSKGRVPQAIAQYDFVLTKGANADAFFDRALAKSLNGDSDGAAQDLDSAGKAGLSNDPASVAQRFDIVMRSFDSILDGFGADFRTQLQRSKVKPNDPEVADANAALLKKVIGVDKLFETVAVPSLHQPSHERLLLALKLLTQSLNDIGDYLKAQSDDTFSDATINVGSAILTETSLSYFGFGVQPPDVSLGTLIASGTTSVVTFPWLFFIPGGRLVLTVLAVNLIGDGLRDALDPNSARGRRKEMRRFRRSVRGRS